jgi:hypothetical protein
MRAKASEVAWRGARRQRTGRALSRPRERVTGKFKVKATVPPGAERQRLPDAQAQEMPSSTDYEKKASRQISRLTLVGAD